MLGIFVCVSVSTLIRSTIVYAWIIICSCTTEIVYCVLAKGTFQKERKKKKHNWKNKIRNMTCSLQISLWIFSCVFINLNHMCMVWYFLGYVLLNIILAFNLLFSIYFECNEIQRTKTN